MASGGANLGVAYVTITPTMSGSVSKIISMLGGIGSTGSKVGSSFGNNFSNSAKNTLSAFAVTAGNLVSSAVSTSMNAIGSSLNSAVSRYDTLNNFPKVMQNLGISSEEAQQAINKMSDGLTGLPTTLDAGASAVQRFTSVNNNVGKSTDYFLALNNAILAGGQSTQIQESALEQLSQAYSKGKMDMMEWRTLQMAMPAQLNQVAQAMGMSTDELGEGLRGGTIAMDDFMETIVQLNDEGIGNFASFSEQAKSSVGGLGTAMTVLQTQVVKGVTSCIQGIDTMLTNSGLQTMAGTISTVANQIKQAGSDLGNTISQIDLTDFVSKWNGTVSLLQSATKEYIEPLKNGIDNIKNAFVNMANTAFPIIQEMLVKFSPIAAQIGLIIEKLTVIVINFITELMQKLQPIIPVIQTVIGVAVEGINNFLNAISGLGATEQVVALLATAFGLLVGKMALSYCLKYATAWLKLGKTFNVIKGAVGGLTGKLTKMIPSLKSTNTAMKTANTSASTGATKILKYAAAVALFGVGVALIATGFALIAQSCIALTTAGTPAMVMFGAMMVSIVALVAVVGIFGSTLTIASAGMLALGAMVLMVCTGLSLLIATIAIFEPQLTSLINTISTNVIAIITVVAVTVIALITTIKDTIVSIVTTIGELICGIISTIGTNIALVISTIGATISLIVSTIGNAISLVVSTIGSVIIGIVSTITAGVVAVVSTVSDAICSIVSTLGDTISNIINSVCSGISEVITAIGTTISDIATSVGDAISTVVESVGEGVKSVCEGIEGVVRGVGDAVSGIFDSIFNGIANVIDSIFSGIQTCGWAIETIANKAWDASAGLAAFTATATGCGWAIGDCAGKLGTMGSAVQSCAGTLTGGASSVGAMQNALSALSSTLSLSISAFNNFANNVNSAMSRALSTVQNKMNEIRNAVNNTKLEAQININCGNLPHFRLEGEFNAETGKVPVVKVDWYKRGGVFTSPSIIGVGEAGNEAVLPLNSKTFSSIADGISDYQKGGSTYNIALNYSASDNARTMFNDLVTRLETLDKVKG